MSDPLAEKHTVTSVDLFVLISPLATGLVAAFRVEVIKLVRISMRLVTAALYLAVAWLTYTDIRQFPNRAAGELAFQGEFFGHMVNLPRKTPTRRAKATTTPLPVCPRIQQVSWPPRRRCGSEVDPEGSMMLLRAHNETYKEELPSRLFMAHMLLVLGVFDLSRALDRSCPYKSSKTHRMKDKSSYRMLYAPQPPPF